VQVRRCDASADPKATAGRRAHQCFPGDLLHHLDLEVALGDELLEARVRFSAVSVATSKGERKAGAFATD